MGTLAHHHFQNIFGNEKPRSAALNWDELELEHMDLSDMEGDLSLEEIKQAIDEIPADTAPGPAGFSVSVFVAPLSVIVSTPTLVCLHLS